MHSRRQLSSNIRMFISLLLVLMFLSFHNTPAIAKYLSKPSAEPVVHAILFYSPSCGHCHKVIEQDLPPIAKKYGAQLEIIVINVATPEGSQLFRSAAEFFIDVREIRGVPTMIVGDRVLVGSLEIPEQLPGIIDLGLAQGGIELPSFPGLSDALQDKSEIEPVVNAEPTTKVSKDVLLVSQTSDQSLQTPSISSTDYPIFIQKFFQDPIGNSIAVITLIGMIISVIVVGYCFLRPPDETSERILPNWLSWPNWVIPVLCILGFGVAGYMSYVEITHIEAICGPLGDCNSVQQSPYAILWGFLPVGVLGIIGFISIGIVWLIHRYSTSGFRKLLSLSMWGMALLGTLFSIYLTFLEPFVIGATCAWCISSAILITLLLLATTGSALQALAVDGKSVGWES
jgi:uncharacterized membrane protein/thiol-disulfide isomerase/thioredoxin